MLEFTPMPSPEAGVPQDLSQETISGGKTPKTDSKVPVNFIGETLRTNPELIEKMDPIDRYILFARSDYVNRPNYKEIGKIFGITRQETRQIYHRVIKTIWRQSDSKTQISYPIAVIFAAAGSFSAETGAKLSEANIKRFQDPNEREKIRAAEKGKTVSSETRDRLKEAQKSRFQNPEERAWLMQHLKDVHEANRGPYLLTEERAKELGIDIDDFGLWMYAKNHQLTKAIVKKGFLTQAELTFLSVYFNKGEKPLNLSDLLDKLSIGVANLA